MAANEKGNGDQGSSAEEAKPPDEEAREQPSPAEADEPEGDAKAEVREKPAPEVAKDPGPQEAAPERKGARWADPISRFEVRWTWFEARLITFVLLWQLAALVSWVLLNGLSESVTQSAGVVFRGALGGIVFGVAAWFGGRKLNLGRRRAITLAALAVGLALAPLWRVGVQAVLAFEKPLPGTPAGPPPGGIARGLAALDHRVVDYFDNIKGWLQGGSTLTLMGGLRGLGTRLTLWLALLGGSLATGAGKHIHIDVIFRFLPPKLRIPSAIINYSAAALVCTAGAWGFFDHIAIEYYGSRADDARGAKIANSMHQLGDHLFFTRKQIGLDLRSLPHVLKGERYDRWMTAAEWNAWLDDAGFEDRFPAEQVKALHVPADAAPHPPLVLSPSGENPSGMLAHTLGLVFPFGLLAIALRFLIRALLTLSGHLSPDPDEAHKEDIRGAAPAGKEGGV